MRPQARLQRIGRALLAPGALLTIAALFIAVLVWFLGPLLAFGEMQPLGPASVRLTILLIIVFAWGVAGFFIRIRRSKEDQALIAALRRQQDEERQAAGRNEAAIEAELASFRAAARGAMRFVKKGGSLNPFLRDRYKMPWYLVLGSQGAGKTAVILNSGLNLPYQGETATDAAANFHLADQAVLIEIGGRFVERSQPQATSLWLRMLDHVRRLRPHQPVNGIVITVSAGELMAMTPEAVVDFASTLRRRLDETISRLRSRAPVYIVISKLDLLVGFQEFFDALSAEERAAILGFPLQNPQESAAYQPAAARFKQGFAEIVDRLSAHLLLRLQEEPDEHRRRRAVEFPSQFAAMQAALEPFISHMAAARRYDAAPLVRGLFFTSATQSDPSVDLLTRPLSESFAQQPGRFALRGDGGTPHGRPYFLGKLIRDVIVPESNLGGLSRPAAILVKAQGIAANVVVTIAALALITFWWLGFSEGRAYTTRLEEGARDARASIAAAVSGNHAPSSFEPVLAALDDLRALDDERPGRSTFGLYGTSNVEEAARAAYHRGLGELLFPYVWHYLRNGVGDPQTSAYLRFQQLKLYLMLSGERPVEEQAAALLGADFSDKWLPYQGTPQVDAVSGHFARLAAAEIPSQQSDAVLVDRARGRLADYTLARLAYDSLGAQPEIRQLPVWRPVDHMGMSGPQALARVSGASFWDGIPGLFTRSGFLDTALPATGAVSEALAADLWVMGVGDAAATREAQRIRDGMLDLYRVDYIRHWDSLLSDLSAIDGASAGDVARAQAILTGTPSPVKELTAAIATETNLLPDANPLDALPGAAAAQVNRVAATVLAPRRVINVGEAVTSHFKAYIQAVSPEEGQQSQVDAMLAALEPLYRQINHVATGGDVLELGAQPQTLLNQLGEQASALPAPLQPLFRRILAQAAAVTGGSSRERLSQIWTTTVAPVCMATTSGRYPFEPSSSNDTSIADFTSLFGPKGLITAFRNDYLKPYIDTTAKPWRWRVGQQVGLDLSDEVLATFERADEITTAYFGEAEAPAVNFTVEPARLDPKARALQFDIGGPTLVYAHGPPMSAAFRWPPERTDADAILSMTPEVDGERNMLRRQGPWALFRLFDAGRVLQREPTDVVPFGFSIGSRKVVLNVTAPATKNPFAKDILAGFRCPTF